MIPRRNLVIGGVVLMLAVVWTIATRDYTGLIVFAVSFVAFWFFLWQKIRSSGRRG